jgi:putative tryptophan/tyrosine transport system substrate-binding protein
VGVPCCLIKATVGPNPRDRSGLVASLARPGGNVTGLSLTSPELAGKRLQLLREVVPRLRRLAILANVDYPPAMQELDEIETSAQKLGVETIALKFGRRRISHLPSRH